MPKAAHANTAPSEEKQVSKATFLKSLDKQRATASAAAKKERRVGYPTDAEILDRLEIAPGDTKTFSGAVSAIKFSFAKDDANRPAFRFNYVITSDNPKYNGCQVDNFYILEEQKPTPNWQGRSLEEAQAELFGEFQGLGEDTSAWAEDPRKNPLHYCVDAAEQHTAAKTPISLAVTHWISKDKSKTGKRVTVKCPLADDDNSDLDASEESTDGFDPNQWIDGVVTFPGTDGPMRGKITAFTDDNCTHVTILDENNEVWEDEYAVDFSTVEWCDDQTWE